MIGPTCPSCGFVHSTADVQAVGRFNAAAPTRYVAANAGTPPRATRAEAERDECEWRRTRPRPAVEFAAEDSSLFAVPEPPADPPQPFPAARMETAAREKAWLDFLGQVRMSLLVWDIDGDVLAGAEHVLSWLRRCRDDLVAFTGEATA